MQDREVMQMALDALETVTAKMLDCRDELAEYGGRPKSTGHKQRLWDSSHDVYVDSAIPAATTLRAALAQGEQKPVAWGIANTRPTERQPLMMVMLDEPEPSPLAVPLYTTPPQQPIAPPEGYALISVDALKAWGKYDEVKAACCYPNAAPAQVEPEPVVCEMTAERAAYFMRRFRHEEKLLGPNEQAALDFVIATLAAPPQRPWQWLTDEDIEAAFMANTCCDDLVVFEHIARAIEAKLKEKNHG